MAIALMEWESGQSYTLGLLEWEEENKQVMWVAHLPLISSSPMHKLKMLTKTCGVSQRILYRLLVLSMSLGSSGINVSTMRQHPKSRGSRPAGTDSSHNYLCKLQVEAEYQNICWSMTAHDENINDLEVRSEPPQHPSASSFHRITSKLIASAKQKPNTPKFPGAIDCPSSNIIATDATDPDWMQRILHPSKQAIPGPSLEPSVHDTRSELSLSSRLSSREASCRSISLSTSTTVPGFYVIPASVRSETQPERIATSGRKAEQIIRQHMIERRSKPDRPMKDEISSSTERIFGVFGSLHRRADTVVKANCKKKYCLKNTTLQQICNFEGNRIQTEAERQVCSLCWPEQDLKAIDAFCTKISDASARLGLGVAAVVFFALVGCCFFLLPQQLRRRERRVANRMPRKASLISTIPLKWYRKFVSLLRLGSYSEKAVLRRAEEYPRGKVPVMPPAIHSAPLADVARGCQVDRPHAPVNNNSGSSPIDIARWSSSKSRASGSSVEEHPHGTMSRKAIKADPIDTNVIPSSGSIASQNHSGD